MSGPGPIAIRALPEALLIRVITVALLLAATSCASTSRTNDSSAPPSGSGAGGAPEGPLRAEESRVLGIFAHPEDATPVLAPSSVRVGERFTVTVTTTGSGCERLGDTGVLLGERDATLMVYDFTSANRPGIACTMIMKYLKREIPLTFTQPGEAVIRVWGRGQKADSPASGEPMVIERRVEVRG